MKFLCDQMLARLGRWLRAAGYDTVIVDKALPDEEIFQQAVDEGRKLLTRDKSLFERKKNSNQVLWLDANSLEDCVKELAKKVPLNWVLNPFSRCLICNEILDNVEKGIDCKDIPEDVLKTAQTLKFCRKCQKIYWEGSHTKRMLNQLLSWENQKSRESGACE